MYLIIRGHIRNSFNDDELYLFVQKLYEIDTSLEIYIHTWNIRQNNISWRNINNNKTIINADKIIEYFGKLSKLIKYIIIDDDSKILLNGYVSSGKMPLIGWKNYWYGQYSIINFLKNSKSQTDNSIVISLRFDLFSKQIFSNIQHKTTEMLNFVKKYYNMNMEIEIEKNKFIYDNEECNIDNIFLGTIYSQFKLVSKFNFELDDIIQKYGNIHNHEKYVFRVNKDL